MKKKPLNKNQKVKTMKARVKSLINGKPITVIEIYPTEINGNPTIPFVRYFKSVGVGTIYKETELDFNIASRQSEATISGWVARDEGGGLYLHSIQPRKGAMEWHGDRPPITLPIDSFPSLTWQDEPIEVEITIKPKKQ